MTRMSPLSDELLSELPEVPVVELVLAELDLVDAPLVLEELKGVELAAGLVLVVLVTVLVLAAVLEVPVSVVLV